MRYAILLTLLPLPAVAETHVTEVWELFDRPGYDFVIDVPDHLFDIRTKSDQAVVWETNSGDITLDVSSFFGGNDASPSEVLSLRQDSMPNRVVTYEASGDGWAVVSGYEGPSETRIFYERFESGPTGLWAGYVLRWDVARREDVDYITKRLGDSLSVRR